MSHTLSATFKTQTAALSTLLELERAGLSAEQISYVAADTTVGDSFNIEKDNKAAEGGTIGASAGGLLGAIAAGLSATGSVVIPGVNLVVFGAAVAAVAGAGAGATIGGLAGGLIGMGIPEYEAKRYEDEIKDGSVLIVIEAEDSDEAKLVENILNRQDAHNIAA